MLSYNEEDYNLLSICGKMEKDFSKFSTKEYYVYGLAEDADRPHISIGTVKPCPSLLKLVDIFKNNGLIVDLQSPKYNSHKKFKVALGLRKDVRESVSVTRSIIAAIAYAAENNLVVEEDFKFNIKINPSTFGVQQLQPIQVK